MSPAVIVYHGGYGHILQQAAGAMAQSPADYSSPAEGPPPGDRETARRFGQRSAATVVRWNRCNDPSDKGDHYA